MASSFDAKMAEAQAERAARLTRMAAEYRTLGDELSARNCEVAAADARRQAQVRETTARITYAQVHEDQLHQFTAEASELGWPPGSWPRTVDTEIGNGLSLVLVDLTDAGATYRQSLGCITLTVWND
jgi:hypothetical protein